MATFTIGDAKVHITYLDNNTYAGEIVVPCPGVLPNHVWKFSDLHPAPIGFGAGVAYDSRKALGIMARTAVFFGAYYSSDNRGSETPDWAPAAEVADAINNATAWEMFKE